MTVLFWLIPIALGMGIVGLMAFLWSTRSGQYDDLDGAAERVLLDLEEDRPIIDDAGKPATDQDADALLNEGLLGTFPASDPVATGNPSMGIRIASRRPRRK